MLTRCGSNEISFDTLHLQQWHGRDQRQTTEINWPVWATWMRLVSAFDPSQTFAHNCARKCERADWETWLHTGTSNGAHRTTPIFDSLHPQRAQLHFEEKFGSVEKYAYSAVGLWPSCVSSSFPETDTFAISSCRAWFSVLSLGQCSQFGKSIFWARHAVEKPELRTPNAFTTSRSFAAGQWPNEISAKSGNWNTCNGQLQGLAGKWMENVSRAEALTTHANSRRI